MDLARLADALDGEPATADLDLLVLHGSRARGDAVESSDRDFGYLGSLGQAVDPLALVVTLTRMLGTDAVDVVDLGRASALLRFRRRATVSCWSNVGVTVSCSSARRPCASGATPAL